MPETAAVPAIWHNPTSGKQARRLRPAGMDAIVRAHQAGASNSEIAKALGVSKPTVARVLERAARYPDFEQTVSDLSELDDLERELRELDLPEGRVEFLIGVIRYGHLVSKNMERVDAGS